MIQEDGEQQLLYTPAVDFFGVDSFTYTVEDPDGRTATATVNISVYHSDVAQPEAALTKQDPGDVFDKTGTEYTEVVADGILHVTGVADDPDPNDPDDLHDFEYQVQVISAEEHVMASFTSKTRVGPATGPLGDLDLRSVPDGVYEVNLRVWSGHEGNFAEDSKSIYLQSNYKIGNLKFSETDATIHVGGVPVSVIRSYDSINGFAQKMADYGPGWSFDLNDIQFEINEIREQDYDPEKEEWFSKRLGGGRDVSLVLPDGRKAIFPFKYVSGTGVTYAEWGPSVTPGVASSYVLETEPARSEFINILGVWQRNPYVEVYEYDIPNYLLTMPDATRYHISRDATGPHEFGLFGEFYLDTYGKGRLTQIDLPTGEKYFFTPTAVDHKAPGQTGTTPVLRLERPSGLIKAVHDRHTLNPDGSFITGGDPVAFYQYDETVEPPRLLSVHRLRQRPTTAGERAIYDVTSYEYDAEKPYFITGIIDPRGVRVAKTLYDEKGRLKKVESPDARFVEYHHDDPPTALGAVARERLVDSEGNTTIAETDAKGNLLLTVDAKGTRTERTFDEFNNPRGELLVDSQGNTLGRKTTDLDYDDVYSGVIRRALSGTGLNAGTETRSIQEFDAYGRVTRSIDARNVPPTYTDVTTEPAPDFATELYYDPEGRPSITKTVKKDGEGTTEIIQSENVYFSSGDDAFKGMLYESYDNTRTKTVYEYYSQVTYDPTETTKVIGRFGDLKTVTIWDSTGNAVSRTGYEYDVNGRGTRVIQYENTATLTSPSWTTYSIAETIHDAQGRVTKTIDAEGGHSSTEYDSSGRVSTSTDRYGAETRHFYDASGNRVQTEFPDNTISRTATFYQSLGGPKLKHVVTEDKHLSTEPANGTLTIYDELGRVIATDRLKNVLITLSQNGQVTETSYRGGERANPSSPLPHDSQTVYDGIGRVLRTSDITGNWTKCDYDDKGRRWRTTAFSEQSWVALEVVTLNGYDETGNLKWTLDPNQYEVIKSSLSDPDDPGAVASDLLSAHASLITQYTHDDFNRQIRVDYPSHETSPAHAESRFNDSGNRWLEVDMDGKGTAFVHDDFGRLIWVVTDVDPAVISLPATLPTDQAGWITWAKNGRDASDSTATRFEYDDFGRLVAQTDARNNSMVFKYDKMGRRTARYLPQEDPSDPLQGEHWDYDWDLSVSRRSTANPRPNVTRHEDFKDQILFLVYDNMGRLVEKRDSTGALVKYNYTSTGQRARMQDNLTSASPRDTLYVYDDQDRLRIKKAPEGTLTYNYNLLGQLTRLHARNTYTALETNPLTEPPYDFTAINASVVENASPRGADMNYTYDQRNRMETVHALDESFNYIYGTTYSYDHSGNVVTMEYGNNVQSAYAYNVRNQLRRIRTHNYSDTSLPAPNYLVANFDYDEALDDVLPGGPRANWGTRLLSNSGRRNRLQEKVWTRSTYVVRTVNYDYDHLNRLTTEHFAAGPNNGTVSYDSGVGIGGSGDYDAVGNRNQRVVNLTPAIAGYDSVAYSGYNENDWLAELDGTKIAAKFDLNGNTVQFNLDGDTAYDQTLEDQYDYENRLIQAVRPEGIVTLGYDGDGNRVRKTISATVINYLVDDRNPTRYTQVVQESDNAGNILVTYAYGLDLLCQTRNTSTAESPVWTTHYYGYDGLGSVRYLTDADSSSDTYRQVTDTYTYDAFGVQIASSGTVENSYRYTGEQWDDELGMYYLRARYYNPQVGRFWTMDTYEGSQSDPLSLHKYLYCHADPVNRIDPSGHESLISVNATIGIMSYLVMHEVRGGRAALVGARGMFGSNDGVDSIIYGLEVTEIIDEKVGQVALGTAAVAVGYKAIRHGIPALVRGGLKLGHLISQMAKEANGGKVVALGLDAHLGQFADTVDYTFFTNGSKELAKWKSVFDQVMGNANNRIIFILDDVDVWEGVTRAARGKDIYGHPPSATDWELLMIKENPQWWDRIAWTRGGKAEVNPFK